MPKTLDSTPDAIDRVSPVAEIDAPPAHPAGASSGATAVARAEKITVVTIAAKYRRGEPISMLTAYDYPMARLVDQAGVDIILVGDSLAMVVLGHADTLSVTMDEMLHHARAVRRGAERAFLVGDMPFMSYQADAHEAVRNAGRFLQEAGMAAVKLEGGRAVARTVRAIARAGIPVQGHIGLAPQSVHAMGGFKVQGRTQLAATRLLDDALALEAAGCFSIVLEGIPDRLAAYITARLHIPTIGIGAGAGVSGQVLVLHDILGLSSRQRPRFAAQYADLGAAIRDAATTYHDDVTHRRFPTHSHAYSMPDEEWAEFCRLNDGDRMKG